MKEEKKESPIGILWGWGKPYHWKFIGSIALGALFLCSSYCYADVVRGSEFFALYSSLCYCALRLFGKSHILKSFHNNFSHSDLLHAARSPGEYYRKTGPRPDGDDFRYSVRSV